MVPQTGVVMIIDIIYKVVLIFLACPISGIVLVYNVYSCHCWLATRCCSVYIIVLIASLQIYKLYASQNMRMMCRPLLPCD